MSTELRVVDSSVLSETERTELDANIDSLIAAHKNNRQEINRLVFESVAAMTAGEDYERQLANKKGLRRFLGSITGSNKKLQDKINSSRAAAQYASQQTLQRLAEQNLMSFDLITAVNNKLNASIVAVESEINQIYGALGTFFKQSRSDMIQLENRVAKLERNVNLLNWQASIEYQMFGETEYTDLDDTAKVVCLVRDFYDISQGEWTTSDLLLLKAAMAEIGIAPKGTMNYLSFIRELHEREELRTKLLDGQDIATLPPPDYLPVLCGVKKLELLGTEESYIVEAAAGLLSSHQVDVGVEQISDNLAVNFLAQEGSVNINSEVDYFSLILEMLFSLRQAEDEKILASLPEKKSLENTEQSDISEAKTQSLEIDFDYGDRYSDFAWDVRDAGQSFVLNWAMKTMFMADIDEALLNEVKCKTLKEATKYFDKYNSQYLGNDVVRRIYNYVMSRVNKMQEYLSEHPKIEISVDLSEIKQTIEKKCCDFMDEELRKSKYWVLFDESRFEFADKNYFDDDVYFLSLNSDICDELKWTFDALASLLEESIEKFLNREIIYDLKESYKEINTQMEEINGLP